MMPFRSLALALALAVALPVAAPLSVSVVAQERAPAMSLAELMQAAALDNIFTSFGVTVAAAPEAQGVPFNDQYLSAWKGAAAQSFAPGLMQANLTRALSDKFTEAELAELGTFFRSPFGMRISAIENEAQLLPPEDQLAARDEGLALLEAETAGRRPAQIEEIMELVSAEIGRTMLGESMRAMMAGIIMSGAQGDIEVPWDEIDAQLATLLPGLEAEVLMAQRGIMAYAYQDLSEAELDTYMAFLRTDTARKFYAVIGFSVGLVVHEAMGSFGEALAERMKRVGV